MLKIHILMDIHSLFLAGYFLYGILVYDRNSTQNCSISYFVGFFILFIMIWLMLSVVTQFGQEQANRHGHRPSFIGVSARSLNNLSVAKLAIKSRRNKMVRFFLRVKATLEHRN